MTILSAPCLHAMQVHIARTNERSITRQQVHLEEQVSIRPSQYGYARDKVSGTKVGRFVLASPPSGRTRDFSSGLTCI